MSINQIALIFEIVGFFCASIFIAVLKIERINKVLAKIKQAIENKVNALDSSKVKSESIESDLMILLLFFMIWELPKISASMRQRKQITRIHYIKNLVLVYFIGYPLMILIIIPILLLDIMDKMLVFVVKKMTGHEAVTNFMIILGSFLVFIGLIMEFIASYL